MARRNLDRMFRIATLDLWLLKMVEDRNRTAHTYDEETAEEIYRSLPRYRELFEALLGALQDCEKRRAMEENAGESDYTEQ